jgi:hypothetical protein
MFPFQQSQDAFALPLKADPITAAAHPGPASTFMASNAQFMAQAPHSIHFSFAVIFAFLFSILNILCGHTVSHMPQPVHFFSS